MFRVHRDTDRLADLGTADCEEPERQLRLFLV